MVRKIREKARLNIRIDADLVEWARVFALENKTNITDLIVGSLMELRRRYGGAPPKVRQI